MCGSPIHDAVAHASAAAWNSPSAQTDAKALSIDAECEASLQQGDVGAVGAVGAIDPRTRLLAAFAFAALVVSVQGWAALALAAAFAGFTAVFFQLSPAKLWRAIAAFDGSMVFVLLMLPFTTPGALLFSLFGFDASADGLALAARIAAKGNIVIVAMLAMLGSCEASDIGAALARLGLPQALAQLLVMTVRYVGVIEREYRRLRTAMAIRGFQMRCNVHTWRSMGYLFGMIFVRSFERAERISAAMRCRGFSGRFPMMSVLEFRAADAMFASLALIAFAGVGYAQWILPS